MSEIRILPCPCCGAQALLMVQRMGFDGALSVECTDCGLRTPDTLYDLHGPQPGQPARPLVVVRRQVVAGWNRRTLEPGEALPPRQYRRAAPEAVMPS